jgi:hypothetical protein
MASPLVANARDRVIEFSDDFFDYSRERMLARPFVGMLTLAMNMPNASTMQMAAYGNLPVAIHQLATWFLVFTPLIILVTQYSLFVLLAIYVVNNWHSNEDAHVLCPHDRGSYTKLAALAVCALFLIKFMMKALANYAEAFLEFKDVTVDGGNRSLVQYGSCLRGARFDAYCSQFFDIAVMALNLVVVFNCTTVLDVVLNSLAIEFIARIDEEYASFVLSFPVIARHLLTQDINRYLDGYDIDLGTSLYAFSLAPILLTLAACIYLPRCM